MAKASYASQDNIRVGDGVSLTNIALYMKMSNPSCPCGGVYSINPIGVDPTCNYTNAWRKRIVHSIAPVDPSYEEWQRALKTSQ